MLSSQKRGPPTLLPPGSENLSEVVGRQSGKYQDDLPVGHAEYISPPEENGGAFRIGNSTNKKSVRVDSNAPSCPH